MPGRLVELLRYCAANVYALVVYNKDNGRIVLKLHKLPSALSAPVFAFFCRCHRIEINRKATRVGTFEVCVSTHVSLRMFIMQVLASQLPFLANRNAELAVPPLFWPDTCISLYACTEECHELL